MINTENWRARLKQIADQHPNTHPILSAIVERERRAADGYKLSLAYACLREGIINYARGAVTCGSMLLNVAEGEREACRRGAGLSPDLAAQYMAVALAFPDLAQRWRERPRHRIPLAQARDILKELHG